MSLARIALIALLQLTSFVVHGAPPVASTSCSAALDNEPPHPQRLATLGTAAAQATLALAPGHEWLIEARERGNDAIVEVQDGAGRLLARADHPERRTGTRRMIISSTDSRPMTLRAAGKEHEAVTGTVEIVVHDMAALSKYPPCAAALHSLAAADADYAIAQHIGRGNPASTAQTARDAYLRAAQAYLAAESLLDNPADEALRAEAALALAGVRYFDLQDWWESAKWAGTAADLFEHRDPYRHARAQALAAAAEMEMATDSASPAPAAGSGFDRKASLGQARRTLRQLFSFHARRREWYDAALQINNIGVAYTYEGRFGECVAAAGSASRMFATLGETPRRGLALQNRAVCYWGLGNLPQALEAFNRALQDLGPQPYSNLYLLTLNNTALMDYALGHFDDSLRLHDRALALAISSQNRRAEAQSLYGIGVTYYALGDLSLAREFLERSLAIRTAAFNGRGRTATLRSLATVYADLGEYHQAIAFDREAVALATAPTSRALSRIQLAVHTALAGNPEEALNILTDLTKPETVPDPLFRAQAHLARAAIERRGGAAAAALRDLAIAIPVFRSVGGVTERFSADLERARVLRLAGNLPAALAAVDQALGKSEAIRTQTSNPEFRARLQLPLRAAYDLKLDLLWQRFDRAERAGKTLEAARIAALAFHSADSARARSFADIAAQRYSPAVRSDLARDFARRETLYQNLAGLRYSLDSRLDRDGSADPRARALASEIAGVQREVDTLNNAIATRTANAASMALAPSGASTPLPADAAIIAYWLGSESAYAWAVTPAGVHWTRLKDPGTITAAARAFHDSLARLADVPRERRLDSASALYAEIIRPVDPWIAPYHRWFFIPDAALDYVPFGALRADSRNESPFAVMSHDIALAPAAWMLLTPRLQPQAPRSNAGILLVSDPVYELSDPRLHLRDAADSSPSQNPAAAIHPDRSYQRIPGTAREAAAIQALFPAADVDVLTGFQATRERLLQLDWSRYRFIHIATHGYLDARMPQLSALVLSAYDQRGERIEEALRGADLSALTLAADVAVFSGCDTALGEDVLNEGMVGIAYSTLARGAGAVVSSLWQVPDEIGANLMTELYRHLVSDGMGPTAALSASMRSVVRRNPSADPALWAAFQVSVATMERDVKTSATQNKGLP
jgi:CHAT domain-containing protein